MPNLARTLLQALGARQIFGIPMCNARATRESARSGASAAVAAMRQQPRAELATGVTIYPRIEIVA
jgi:uncharacterized protein YqjF (DUF2071 family)